MSADPKPAHRIIATRSQWDDLRFEKLGTCRVCERLPCQLHHLVSRSLGGDDIAANLVPLCSFCHEMVERHSPPALACLRGRLRPEELRYVLDTKGADYLERRYPASALSPSKEKELSEEPGHMQSASSRQSSPQQQSQAPTPRPGRRTDRP